VRTQPSSALLIVLLVLLVTVLYPALVLDRPLAPQSSLKGEPPWRALLGPFPRPAARAVDAATRLGPRLQMIQREGSSIALWNPWIGGGRPGFLAAPEEGGSPLPLLAAMASRPGWVWTALLALLVVASASTSWLVMRLVGVSPWGAAAGAVAYALSGAVTAHWLDWRGSALALGPLVVLAALHRGPGRMLAVARWAAALAVVGLCGLPALPFVALAAFLLLVPPLNGGAARAGVAIAGALLAGAVLLPGWWLQHVGREARAVPAAREIEPRLTRLGELLGAPARSSDTDSRGAVTQEGAVSDGLLGLATLALAVVGVALGRSKARGLWCGVAIGSLALVWLPGSLVGRLGLDARPFGTLALAVCVLAATGVDVLLAAAGDRLGPALGAMCCGLLLWAQLPAVARGLPFASQQDAVLPAPLASLPFTEGKVVGLLGALPPDVGAAMRLPDARAAFFDGEPAYMARLGGGPRLEISAERAMSPELAALGSRFLIEPLPLSVVSGQIFASLDVMEATVGSREGGGAQVAVTVPEGAFRVAVPAPTNPRWVHLVVDARAWSLKPDSTLAAESGDWAWFAVPPGTPAGPARLVVWGAMPPGGAPVQVAWDRSGLEVVREDRGARVWMSGRAAPFAFLAPPATATHAPGAPVAGPWPECPQCGRLSVLVARPGRVVLTVDAIQPSLLVVQVKHRPRLWRCLVDGKPAASTAAWGVWTGVTVPPGQSRVELEAHLPAPLWGGAALGLVCVCCLAVLGRRQ
jgi:hypothetical protein